MPGSFPIVKGYERVVLTCQRIQVIRKKVPRSDMVTKGREVIQVLGVTWKRR